MQSPAPERRYDLDWLRVFAILVVFLYHSTRFFNLGDWHVKNDHTFIWVEMWTLWATRWLMPLFFMISGASLFFALRKFQGFRGYYAGKFQRLMIPVLVGAVTHSALQVYLERVSHGRFAGSFLAFLPEYFHGVYLGIGMPGNFAYHGMHLWYLFFLFLYSMVFYRLFVWLSGSGRALLEQLMAFLARPGLMYALFPVPLLLMKAVIPEPVLEAGSGGWGFLYYIWFLLAGFMMVSSGPFQRRIQDRRWVSLALGALITFAHLYGLFGPSQEAFPGWALFSLSVFSAWCWLFAILGFGMRHLNVNRPFLRTANEGVLPFFILHQPALVLVGSFVMGWDLLAALKWAITFFASFTLVIALYAGIVRRVDLLRFLFGMRPSVPSSTPFNGKRRSSPSMSSTSASSPWPSSTRRPARGKTALRHL